LDRFAAIALEPSAALCRQADIACRTRNEIGPAARTIARVAEDEDVDQIVMGARAFGRVRGYFSGHVSANVVEQSKVP
ncbi:universal stress protein, partial [Acinetobacter baumannii]